MDTQTKITLTAADWEAVANVADRMITDRIKERCKCYRKLHNKPYPCGVCWVVSTVSDLAVAMDLFAAAAGWHLNINTMDYSIYKTVEGLYDQSYKWAKSWDYDYGGESINGPLVDLLQRDDMSKMHGLIPY